MRATLGLGLALCAGALASTPASAQLRSAGVGATVQGYSFGEPSQVGFSRIALWSAPAQLTTKLGRYVSADVAGRVSGAEITRPDGARTTVTGTRELRWAVTAGSLGGGITVRVGGNAPISSTEHSLADAVVFGVTGTELLPFIVDRWVGTLNFTAAVGLRRHFGSALLDLQGGYLKHQGDIRIAGDEIDYRPGDETHARATISGDVGRPARLTVSVGVQRMAADLANGSELFRPGTRLEAIASYEFPLALVGSGALYVSWRDLARGQDLFGSSDELDRLRALVPAVGRTPHRSVGALGALFRLERRALALVPEAEVRIASADVGGCPTGSDSRCPIDESLTLSSGLAAELRLRTRGATRGAPRGLIVSPGGHLRYARLGSGGPSSGALGWDAGVTVRVVQLP